MSESQKTETEQSPSGEDVMTRKELANHFFAKGFEAGLKQGQESGMRLMNAAVNKGGD